MKNDGIPDRQTAETWLAEAAELNPGPWVQHSHNVARGAQLIAAHIPDLDENHAFILGLLHDIGRRFGVKGMRHTVDGYRYLAGKGYEHAARINLTHSYPVKNLVAGADGWDGSAEDFYFLKDYLAKIEYDHYDRLIQLCDAISLPDGFCLMEKRLVDVCRRYGVNQHTIPRWQGFFDVKQDIEALLGHSIYRLLPGVIETTFGWPPAETIEN